MEIHVRFPQKAESNLDGLLLGCQETRSSTFIAAPSQETEKGNSLDVHQLTNGEWKRYIGTVEYYSAAKKKELETVILSEATQTGEDKHCMPSCRR